MHCVPCAWAFPVVYRSSLSWSFHLQSIRHVWSFPSSFQYVSGRVVKLEFRFNRNHFKNTNFVINFTFCSNTEHYTVQCSACDPTLSAIFFSIALATRSLLSTRRFLSRAVGTVVSAGCSIGSDMLLSLYCKTISLVLSEIDGSWWHKMMIRFAMFFNELATKWAVCQLGSCPTFHLCTGIIRCQSGS